MALPPEVCIRGAGITEGLEATIAPGRQHVGANVLLQAALMHASYTVAARNRRNARPSQAGTYHAFTPSERAPQLGDVIVQDRRDGITGAQVQRLLWAGTEVKEPGCGDTRYVDALIGPETIAALALPTLEAFEDHGRLRPMADQQVAEAYATLQALAAAGINLPDIADYLLAREY